MTPAAPSAGQRGPRPGSPLRQMGRRLSGTLVVCAARLKVPRPGREAVAGWSMAPALRAGDWLITLAGLPPRPGDVVVATWPARPRLRVVKRVVSRTAAGWWLEGDNQAASDDSRTLGPVPESGIEATVIARYWPRPSWLLGRPARFRAR